MAPLNPFRALPGWINDPIRASLLKLKGKIPHIYINRGEVALQIGTPNPSTMNQLSYAVGSDGKVIIVEPEPENIKLLKQARENLSMSNVEIVECVAWSEVGEVSLSIADHPRDHKVNIDGIEHDNDYRSENTYDKKITCQAKPIDLIIEQKGLEKVNYVEIMVNGAEMEVLRGAKELLKKYRPIRLLVKGHAKTSGGTPLNHQIYDFLDRYNIKTVITPKEQAVGENVKWNARDGDVFGYAR